MLLALFDMDGTLIDSQAHIVGAMTKAFEADGLTPPTRDAILSIVGLSLDQAMFVLAPEQPVDRRVRLVDGYKSAFMAMRSAGHVSPLYDGALSCLKTLSEHPDVVLGIATGKSRRGVEAVFQQHQIKPFFATVQVADDHPSKPHPAMADAALLESGATHGVMIGDTTYDMQMGKAAGMRTLGVTWGYHSRTMLLSDSDTLCDRFEDVAPHIMKELTV